MEIVSGVSSDAWIHLFGYLLGSVFMAGGIYAGIRKDLHYMQERITRCESEAARANNRIDSIMTSKGKEVRL